MAGETRTLQGIAATRFYKCEQVARQKPDEAEGSIAVRSQREVTPSDHRGQNLL